MCTVVPALTLTLLAVTLPLESLVPWPFRWHSDVMEHFGFISGPLCAHKDAFQPFSFSHGAKGRRDNRALFAFAGSRLGRQTPLRRCTNVHRDAVLISRFSRKAIPGCGGMWTRVCWEKIQMKWTALCRPFLFCLYCFCCSDFSFFFLC